MKSNVVESYAYSNLGRTDIMENKQLGTQCVGLVKHFATEILKRPLGSFGGSAKTGWQNIKNTFPKNEFERIENIYGDPNNIPSPGDLIFWDNGIYGHVGIVLEAKSNSFRCINQNVGNGDGNGADDAVVITEYDYSKVAGWYRYKKFFAEYEGIPCFIRQEQPSDSQTRNGAYIPKKYGGPYMLYYPNFFTKSEENQEAIKEHEYSHYVYFDVAPEWLRTKWEEMSNLTISARIKFALKGKVYKNGYINSHAEKSPSEDWAECWEYYILNETTKHKDAYIQLKIETVVAGMKQFDPRVI